MPTTRKETSSVVPKREVVRRERGWREGCGDMACVFEVVREGRERSCGWRVMRGDALLVGVCRVGWGGMLQTND